MRFMYTTTPDKHCHDFGNGVYGRPVFQDQEAGLIKKGWVFNENKLPKTEKAEETKEEVKNLSRDELAESLGVSLFDEDGKKLHYKLIDRAIKEAQNGEHNES